MERIQLMTKHVALTTLFFILTCSGMIATSMSAEKEFTRNNDPFPNPFEETDEIFPLNHIQRHIPDPIEGFNRVMFAFNDKLYFYSLKPTAKAYKFVVPEPVRKSVNRFFLNLSSPARIINFFFQGKIRKAGISLSRLLINTTIGIAGFFDPAKKHFALEHHSADFAQTIGIYGVGPGFYVVWPFLGPSSIRGTAGTVLDTLLDPLYYVKIKTWKQILIGGYEIMNDTSLRIGEYESLKEMALDPYVSLRNAYFQHRLSIIKKK